MNRIITATICLMIIIFCSSCSTVINTANKSEVEIPEYLSDCDAQFNETDNQLLVSFGLKNKTKNYITSNGTANIVIKDKTKNTLYKKAVNYKEKDFSDYTSKLWKGTRLLCGIYIDADKIKPAANDEGVVELTITAADKQVFFDTQKLEVLDLPTKEIEIKKPKLPQNVSYFDYDKKETVVSVTSVTFKTDILSDYASVDGKATVKMIKNNLEDDSDYFTIKFVLKDSKNVVVKKDEVYCDSIKNGESEYIDFSFTELDANESYKLAIESVDDSID